MSTQKTRWYHYLTLIGILGTALFFRLYNLAAVGYGNLYYASTVYSMLTGAKNFFFAAFDPAGFVSVDKPPLGFWVQALSAWLFGFEGWALILPQVVAGALACLVLFWLVRRAYGPAAGLVAALILALTPIAVAADRNNTIDAQLLLVLLLSAGAVILAAEKGSLKWLLAGAVLVGIGFNIKMLQAYMVLPALYGFYLLCARTTWARKFIHLALASLVLAAVSFAWVAAVDLTPAGQRPYVGSSQDNTMTELIGDHNGLKRLGEIAVWLGLKSQTERPEDGLASQPPSGRPPLNEGTRPPLPPAGGQGPRAAQPFAPSFPPPQPGDGQFAGNQPSGPNNGPLGQNETGTASALRLFNEQLVGQASWLLPLALFMLLALALRNKWTWPLNPDMRFALFWGLWLIPMVVFFSFAGLFHRYYLEMLAPAVAALAGAGLVALGNDFVEGRWQGWLLPLAILGGAAFESATIAAYFMDWAGWLIPIILFFGVTAALGLVLTHFVPQLKTMAVHSLLMVALVALLAAPMLWSTTPLQSGDVGLPFAGPELMEQRGQARNDLTRYTGLVDYLQANYAGETFIVAGANANLVAPLILLTGEAGMAIGGFTGSDPILTVQQFASYVQQGQLRFVLAGDERRGGQEIMQWVRSSCRTVDPGLWRGPEDIRASSGPDGMNRLTLYDCQ